MKKSTMSISTVLSMGVLLATLYGCQKQEGPVERAGKEVDEAVEKAGDQVEKVGDDIKDATKGDNDKK